MAALREDAVASRDARRTAGGRLDTARAKAARAWRGAQEARRAAEVAAAVATELESAAEAVAAELAAVKATLAATAPTVEPAQNTLMADKVLLAELEKAPMPGTADAGPNLSESLLAPVASLRSHIDETPLATARLDEPLEPDGRTRPSGTPAPDDASGDELMGELDAIAESDDEALLAVARRLERARHNA